MEIEYEKKINQQRVKRKINNQTWLLYENIFQYYITDNGRLNM